MGRYMSVWLPYLLTDRTIRSKPELKEVDFVLSAVVRGRIIVQASGSTVTQKGVRTGMAVTDARAILPNLQVFNYQEDIAEKTLLGLAEWALRFTPVAAVDMPDGIILDTSGCTHLWGGEVHYLNDIICQLDKIGYSAKAAIADTVGAAWALARYGKQTIIAPGAQMQAIQLLPPAGLRLEPFVLDRMYKLGFHTIGDFMHMPHPVLRRRFGPETLKRIGQASGTVPEPLKSVQPAVVFQVCLPCLEPIKTRTGIEIALKTLLDRLSHQLYREGKGLRKAVFKGYRIDGAIQQIAIGTNRPVRNVKHLLQLFEQKISAIQPALGIELFVMEAPVVEKLSSQQEALWAVPGCGNENNALANLLDRIAGRAGAQSIRRYLPVEQYWPERSVKLTHTLFEQPDTEWKADRPRPICLLEKPERIKVMVPVPDYPPMMFIYKGIMHKIRKADGPERIAREWWQDDNTQIRDYYRVEDEAGARYWLFRSGTYDQEEPAWFIHGFFA